MDSCHRETVNTKQASSILGTLRCSGEYSGSANEMLSSKVEAMGIECPPGMVLVPDGTFRMGSDRHYEPWLPRDKAMIDMLRSVGIEKGKPFEPDAKKQEILKAATEEAHAWFNARYETAFAPYFGDKQWFIPATPELMTVAANFYEGENAYPIDARGLTDYWAFSTVKHLGEGQFYLMSIRDAAGQPLDGNKNYHLVVPANAPVTQYWSAVVYDRATHAHIRETSSQGKSSQTEGLKTNADGSVDLYLGPSAPEGKESNWAPTNPGGQFEVLFRLYGPQKPLFDKTWVLPDIEEAK